MQNYDFHGVSYDDAIAKVHEVVSAIRLSGEPENVVFITGHGVLKYEVRDILEKTYGLTILTPTSSPLFSVLVE